MKKKTIGLPDPGEINGVLKEIFDDPRTQPDFVQEDSLIQEESVAMDVSATRTAQYKGHDIEIKTTYEIRIDGELFPGHVMVDDEGHLHCHSIPYATYGSAVDFVKSLIDIYPDTYGPERRGQRREGS